MRLNVGDAVWIEGIGFLDRLGLYLFGDRPRGVKRAWLGQVGKIICADHAMEYYNVEMGSAAWRMPGEYLRKMERFK